MNISVLIVDDEEKFCNYINAYLVKLGFEVHVSSTLTEAHDYIKSNSADVILLDIQLPDGSGLSLLEETNRLSYRPVVIVVTCYADVPLAVEAMKNGAYDLIEKPIDDLAKLGVAIQRASETIALRRELAHLRESQHRKTNFVIGQSPTMQMLVDKAKRAASASVSVLITGESGTGKEVLARYIHSIGPRADKPFIDVPSPSIQSTLVESELFGYEPNAFTGAEKRKHGLMEIADKGILFLDEISSMPMDIQSKLLRALEERAFRRVGGTTKIQVDVQILAASNRDLPTLISQGLFREDLYYRLKVVDLHLPPLRERKCDIPELAGMFIRQNNARLGMNINDISPRAMQALLAYDWPGNIRELRNVIESAMLFCDEEEIDLAHLPGEIARLA